MRSTNPETVNGGSDPGFARDAQPKLLPTASPSNPRWGSPRGGAPRGEENGTYCLATAYAEAHTCRGSLAFITTLPATHAKYATWEHMQAADSNLHP